MTNNCLSSFTMPAEWDPRVNTVIMAYPQDYTDWAYMLEDAQTCFDNIIRALAREADMNVILIAHRDEDDRLRGKHIWSDGITLVDLPHNDTWARDFGYITIENKEGELRYVDFRFNGWGLKFPSDKDNMICRRLSDVAELFPSDKVIDRQDFILEGGSIESDGQGTLLTTSRCLLSPNRNSPRDKSFIEEKLKQDLGVSRVLWLNHGYLEGDDTDSHIDTLARFVAPDAIAYVAPPKVFDSHFAELQLMEKEIESFRTAEGKPYKLFPLPLPDPVYDEHHNRLPATYANFLITPRAVLVPVYNQPDNDTRALERLQAAFPSRKMIPIDCTALIRQHGSLHCVTMQTILP